MKKMIPPIDPTYRTAFETAKAELFRCREDLGDVIDSKAELEVRIAKLRETVIALGRMFGEEFDEADALGLTDAIRQTFMAQQNTQLTAQNVRDRLEFMGFSLEKYGNALASIHTVIKRLLEKGEIEDASKSIGTPISGGDKPAYSWKSRRGNVPRTLTSAGRPLQI